MDTEVIIEKVNVIKRCLSRIEDITGGDPNALNEINAQDAYVLNLQRAIQATIDLANVVIKHYQWSLASTYRETFETLHEKKVISTRVSGQMQQMCGFRNIAVHDYRKIDIEILKSILTNDLHDIEKYYHEVLQYTNPGE